MSTFWSTSLTIHSLLVLICARHREHWKFAVNKALNQYKRSQLSLLFEMPTC